MSNCKSIGVTLLPKDGIAAPFRPAIRRLRVFPTEEESKKQLLSNDWTFPPPPLSPEELLAKVLLDYRGTCPAMRRDFQEAFELIVREVFAEQSMQSIGEAWGFGQLSYEILDDAAARAQTGFRHSTRDIWDPQDVFALPEDRAAQVKIDYWLQQMTARAGADALVVDLRGSPGCPPGGLDATDQSLRSMSTDFGNFVADCIKAATAADIALINSGAFRYDGLISPELTLNRLRDVFIYDGSRAITLCSMTAAEVLAFYDHATNKSGLGAFLQVSEPREAAAERSGQVRVALLTYMLIDDEDGFQSILMKSRSIEATQLLQAIDAQLLGDSMITLIADGARKGVRYSAEPRLTGATQARHRLDEVNQEFIAAVDRYRHACSEARINTTDALAILSNNTSDIPRERIHGWDRDRVDHASPAVTAVRNFVRASILRDDWPGTQVVLESLSHCREGFERQVRYQDYLQAAYSFFFDR